MAEPQTSILFPDTGGSADTRAEQPPYFTDLNLDQVVDALTAGRAEYDLAPFFRTPARDLAAIAHRHDVFRDLENPDLAGPVHDFGTRMREMRRRLAQSEALRHPYQRKAWFLDAVDAYCDAVCALARDLTQTSPASAGLAGVRDFVIRYSRDAHFTGLADATRALRARLAQITYTLQISGGRVRVSAYEEQPEQPDYGAEVMAVFEKFRQDDAEDHRAAYRSPPAMNHVEEAVVDRVARLFPDAFAALEAYGERRRDFLDPTVAALDREAQFYLAYVEYIAPLKAAGLSFCYPHMDDASKEEAARDTFDLALAAKLTAARAPVVPNDFHLSGPERVIVVSGPNQGGKTTFARAFGQLHHLAALGCPVPGSQARLLRCDRLFTHFERGENLTDLSGKLCDDLLRMHDILDQATGSSVVVINEVFTSTTSDDAVLLGTRVLESLIERDVLCVCVTFVDELACLGRSTVSMVSTVVPGDPSRRTFRVVRGPAGGLAHALAVAEQHRLTYRQLKERIT